MPTVSRDRMIKKTMYEKDRFDVRILTEIKTVHLFYVQKDLPLQEEEDMTGTTRKNYRMTDECLQVIKETQERRQFATQTQALHHIITEYRCMIEKDAGKREEDDVARKIAAAVKAELTPLLRQIRSSGSETEHYAYLMLDAINTMLYDANAAFLIPAFGEMQHKVLEESEENYRERLAHRKQNSDNRKWRR